MARKHGPQNGFKNAPDVAQKRSTLLDVHEASLEPPPPSTTDLLKALNKPIEAVNKSARRKLQAQHKARVKKAEEGIKQSLRPQESTCSEYRISQLNRLLDLVKRKTEIETRIIAQLQSLSHLYGAASDKANATVSTRLSDLH
ncbi:hypothetical protein PRK78_005599 [Emydomyces testavorans]|uniref:Uncharacterized protein n=1 Tax=Emydomyces testavorans TaxID=2070801 RepID=A0AAF0DJV5_9EURO|nr:hypothetical protein PRK78_005599 [Emydomyces testavorans]